MSETERRTKRRYAHELYPHAEEYEIRSLDVDVPYLYAIAVGYAVQGTGWFDAPWRTDEWASLACSERTIGFITACQRALLADALLQGLGGQEAWEWAESRYSEDGELFYERAIHYGVPVERIKPYPCGPEPEHHDHRIPSDRSGWWALHRIDGRESECADCTEPVEAGGQ